MSGVIFHYQKLLYIFLDSITTIQNGLRWALKADLADTQVVNQLGVLGLIGKLLSGPWMEVVYANPEGLSNLEICPVLRDVLANLGEFKQSPVVFLEKRIDMFGRPLDMSDSVLENLLSVEFSDVQEPLVLVVSEIEILLKRQLKNYIEDTSTAETLEKTKTAPVHNMEAERILGMADYQLNRAPNASIEFIQGKVKYKKNDTASWIKAHVSPSTLIAFAIKRGRSLAAKQKERRIQLENIYRYRVDAKQIKKVEGHMRALIQKASANIITREVVANELQSEPECVGELTTVLNSPSQLVGRVFTHSWAPEEGKTDPTLFIGHVMKKKKCKKPTFVVSYWTEEEGEQESSDWDMTLENILTDLFLGDLHF